MVPLPWPGFGFRHFPVKPSVTIPNLHDAMTWLMLTNGLEEKFLAMATMEAGYADLEAEQL